MYVFRRNRVRFVPGGMYVFRRRSWGALAVSGLWLVRLSGPGLWSVAGPALWSVSGPGLWSVVAGSRRPRTLKKKVHVVFFYDRRRLRPLGGSGLPPLAGYLGRAHGIYPRQRVTGAWDVWRLMCMLCGFTHQILLMCN